MSLYQMILCKIESEVLSKAMKSHDFFALRCYLEDFFKEEENVFVSRISMNQYTSQYEVEFRLALDDYFCNEDEEVNKLLEFAKQNGFIGKDGNGVISNTIVKTIKF